MKNIDDLRELLGETEERVYDGMSMADMFAVFIQRLVDNEVVLERLQAHDMGNNAMHIHAADRMTKLERRIMELEAKDAKRTSTYSHWTDAPRLIRS